MRTSPLRINYVEEVGLVNLYPVVRSAGGNYVADLTQEDFTVLEDGKEQAILRFSTERRPLRIGIVLDTSLSMEGKKLQNASKAALEFLDILEPGDEGMVVTFSDRVQIMQEITSDRKLMAEAIESVEALGGTALYDAIWRTSSNSANSTDAGCWSCSPTGGTGRPMGSNQAVFTRWKKRCTRRCSTR